ncbi:uncharacterized protein LOC143247363 isoform X1 [Tachypleus tridentatus]|uniref:uncharacterized protein LOC143247363 isoform X1 n=1 Tax=Tachypleus tridentatus TaxID=6853 RepID=UPI003FCF8CF0
MKTSLRKAILFLAVISIFITYTQDPSPYHVSRWKMKMCRGTYSIHFIFFAEAFIASFKPPLWQVLLAQVYLVLSLQYMTYEYARSICRCYVQFHSFKCFQLVDDALYQHDHYSFQYRISQSPIAPSPVLQFFGLTSALLLSFFSGVWESLSPTSF